MSAPDRPLCRALAACKAKGSGHCRGCVGAATFLRIKDDPSRAEARRRPTTEAAREKIRVKINARYADPAFRKAVSEQARRHLDAMRRDPEINRRRVEAISRALSDPDIRRCRSKSLSRAMSLRTAKRVGIPVELVPLFREIRDKTKAPDAEVRSAVLSSREAADLREKTARIERVRAAGPAPAIGSPRRAAWTQRVNAAVAEARPC